MVAESLTRGPAVTYRHWLKSRAIHSQQRCHLGAGQLLLTKPIVDDMSRSSGYEVELVA